MAVTAPAPQAPQPVPVSVEPGRAAPRPISSAPGRTAPPRRGMSTGAKVALFGGITAIDSGAEVQAEMVTQVRGAGDEETAGELPRVYKDVRGIPHAVGDEPILVV